MSDKFSPQYEAIQLPGRWHASEQADIHKHDQQSEQQVRTSGEVAIHQSRLRTLPRICALLVPVALSFAILQLSWRHRYWRDSNDDPQTISEHLALFQIAAKAHEVLVVLSLSDLAIHYLRHQLCTSKGLPFGLLISAYQVALGGQPLSFGFLYSVKSSIWRRDIQWQSLALSTFLLLATLLALAAGPSSAVALIPRLNWWPNGDLFVLDPKFTPFAMYIPKPLFPSVVDASSLPGPFCLEAGLDVNSTCPSAGFDKLLSTLRMSNKVANSSIDSPLSRVMATDFNAEAGIASSWTQSHVITNYMFIGSSVRDTTIRHAEGTTNQPEGDELLAETSSTLEAMAGDYNLVMAPIVRVDCQQEPATKYIRNVHDLESSNPESVYSPGKPLMSGTYDVRDIWDEKTLSYSNVSMVAFEDNLANITNSPSGLLAFVYLPVNLAGSLVNTATVSICGIDATWEPSTMWLLRGDNRVVSSNFTWPSRNQQYYTAYSRFREQKANPMAPERPIMIRKAWADTLNPSNKTSNTSVLAQLLLDGIAEADQQGFIDGEYTSSAQANVLSKAIADGLARIGAEYRFNQLPPPSPSDKMFSISASDRNITGCREGRCFGRPFMDGVARGTSRGLMASGGYTFPEPDDIATTWTRVRFPIKRYGYGWSFNTVTVKIATAILMLHSLIIITHCCHLLLSGRSYAFANSLGELVSLTLHSRVPVVTRSAPVVLDKTTYRTESLRSWFARIFDSRSHTARTSESEAVDNVTHWTRPSVVREVRRREERYMGRLELITDHSGDGSVGDGSIRQRPVVGREYL